MNKKILIVAAHPDDEILGCGGTVAKLAQNNYEIYTLILGQGKTSRGDSPEIRKEIKELKAEAERANKILGVKEIFLFDFPDNEFDKVSLLTVVKKIEEIKNKIKPNVIFTHHRGDLNVDHQITNKAVMVATRPMAEETVKDIYTFEVQSSTEWNSHYREDLFIPNVFIDIAKTLELKIAAMNEYKSELREFPHPRSLNHIKTTAFFNGTKVGLKASENFCLLRSIRDIL